MQLGQLNWLDYVIIGIIAISVLISLVRGFVREALSLITWAVAFLVAFNFSHDLSLLFSGHIKSASASYALAFAILFLVTLLIGAVVNYLLSTLVKKTGLSGTDRVFGMILGGVRGVLVVAVLILLAGFTTLPKETAWQHSVLLPHFQSCVTWLEQFIPDALDFITGQ
ncbi:MAG: colicin V production CvpA [Legionellales bacterium]|nr:colicin V production CvpA [Legionellales bacterium]